MANDPATGAIPEQFDQHRRRGHGEPPWRRAPPARAGRAVPRPVPTPTSRTGCSSARGSTAAAMRSDRSGPMRFAPSTSSAAASSPALQARLKRLDLVARQLDLLWGYLDSPDESVDEPRPDGRRLAGTRLSLRIVQAQEDERQRMAEDIHDGPAQVLTNAIFQVEYLDRMLDPDRVGGTPRSRSCATCCATASTRCARFITDLRPPGVDVGLAAAIADRARQHRGAARRSSSRSRVDGIDERLGPAARASVLRILQEALQNVRKHAAASRISIGLEGDTLVIADNGRGFDLDAGRLARRPELRAPVHARARGADRGPAATSSHDRAKARGSCCGCRSRGHDSR